MKKIPDFLMDASGLVYRIMPVRDGQPRNCFRVVPLDLSADVNLELRVRYGFTDREAQVAMLLGRRATNREIAEQLGISLHTVRHHAGKILEKAKLRSRVQMRSVITRLRERDA